MLNINKNNKLQNIIKVTKQTPTAILSLTSKSSQTFKNQHQTVHKITKPKKTTFFQTNIRHYIE